MSAHPSFFGCMPYSDVGLSTMSSIAMIIADSERSFQVGVGVKEIEYGVIVGQQGALGGAQGLIPVVEGLNDSP